MSEDVVGDPPMRLSRVRWSTPHLKAVCAQKGRRVIVTGSSLLRGMESPVCFSQTLPTWKNAAFLGPRSGIFLRNLLV